MPATTLPALLLATITLTPAPGDNAPAIQAAIDKSQPGDKLVFAEGSYRIATPLRLLSDRTYAGDGAVILQWAGGNDFLMKTPGGSAKDITITGLTFVGAGIKYDSPATRVHTVGNTFRDFTNRDPNVGNALFIAEGVTDCRITGNTFRNIPWANGIYFYTADRNRFERNTFEQVSEGIHGIWFANGSDISVSHNIGKRITRFFIELQTGPKVGPTNLTVAGNFASDWLPQGPGRKDSHIALSIATGGGKRVFIRNNILIGDGEFPKTPDYRFTAIEAMGEDITIEGNYAANWGWAQLVGFTKSWETKNNTWVQITRKVIVPEQGYEAAPRRDEGNSIVKKWDGKIPPLPPEPATAPATSLATDGTPNGATAAEH